MKREKRTNERRAKEPRGKRVTVCLTGAEHAAWTAAAGKVSLGAWIRRVVGAVVAVERSMR